RELCHTLILKSIFFRQPGADETVAARASRPCVGCTIRTGGTPAGRPCHYPCLSTCRACECLNTCASRQREIVQNSGRTTQIMDWNKTNGPAVAGEKQAGFDVHTIS